MLDSSPVMTFLRKSGSLVVVWIKSFASEKRCFFCSYCRSHGTNFATTCFMARSCIEIWHSSFGVPRSASSSRTVSNQSLLIAAHTRSTFSGVLLVSGLPEHGSLSKDSQTSLKHLCNTLICSSPIALSPKAFWIIQIVAAEDCSSLMQNLMQICCSTRSAILNVMATQYTC